MPSECATIAAELVALAPDVICRARLPASRRLQQATRTMPIVFTLVGDPVGGGFVASLARPAATSPGFTLSNTSLAAKWLELLREIAPRVDACGGRVAIRPSARTAIRARSRPWRRRSAWSLTRSDVRDAAEIERAVRDIRAAESGGLIVTRARFMPHRELIIALAARHLARRLSLSATSSPPAA